MQYDPSTEMDGKNEMYSTTRKKTLHYPWIEVDNPVELHNQAGFAVLETELWILKAWARPQQGPGEPAGPPFAHVALQVPAVLILRRLLWGRKGFIVTHRGHTHKKKNNPWGPVFGRLVLAGNHLSGELKELLRKAYLHSPRRSSGLPVARRHTYSGTPSWQWCRAGSMPSLWYWRWFQICLIVECAWGLEGRTRGFPVIQTNTDAAFGDLLCSLSSERSLRLAFRDPTRLPDCVVLGLPRQNPCTFKLAHCE